MNKQKMSNKKLKIVTVPILNDEYKVYILFGEKLRVTKWLNNYFEINDIDSNRDFNGYRARCFYRKGFHPCIYVSKGVNLYSELSHEAVHAIDYIFNYIGDDNRGELFAHSVGAVVRAVEK